MSYVKYIYTNQFLTSTTIQDLLIGVTEDRVKIVSYKGADPNFLEKYTILLNTQYCDYIRQHGVYECTKIKIEKERVTITFCRVKHVPLEVQ